MGLEPGLPSNIGEFEEFNRTRFSSGLDNKQGLNVFVISGSAAGGGGGGDSHITSGVVQLEVSGMGLVTSKSGSLDATKNPLHVLVISGSVAGSSQITTLSGSVVGVSGETVIAKVSGETLQALISGQPVVLAVSGPRYPSAGSGLDLSTVPLHVMAISGSAVIIGSGSLTAVRIRDSLSTTEAQVGSTVDATGSVNALDVRARGFGLASGGTAWDRLRTMTALSGSVWSGFPRGVLAVGFVSGAHYVGISGETVQALISGQPVTAVQSGAIQVASGLVVLTSGQTEYAQVSGQLVYLATSGMPAITSYSGSLDTGKVPLHVLVISGSAIKILGLNAGQTITRVPTFVVKDEVVDVGFAERGFVPMGVSVGQWEPFVLDASQRLTVIADAGTGFDPSTIRSGTIALFASGMGLITAKSGSLDPNAIPLHVLVISGSVAGTGAAADPVTIRSGTTALFASGMGLLTAKSGSLDPNAVPLHVFIVSGSVVGTGAPASDVHITSGVVYLAASGGPIITAGSGSLLSGAVPLHVLTVSGSIGSRVVIQGSQEGVPVDTSDTSTDGQGTSLVGLVIQSRTYGFTVREGGGPVPVFDRLRTIENVFSASGDPMLSGRGVLAVALVSGWSSRTPQLAKVSGETLSVSISGQVVSVLSGSPITTSGQFHPTSVSGQPVVIGVSGPTYLRDMLSVSGSNTLSGNVPGVLAVGFVSGYNVVTFSGQTVLALVSGQPVGISGATVVTSVSGQVVSILSGAPINISGQFTPTSVSGQPVGVSGATVVVSVSGQIIFLGTSGMPAVTSRSGSLDPNAIPLHVLSVSGGTVAAQAYGLVRPTRVVGLSSGDIIPLQTALFGGLKVSNVISLPTQTSGEEFTVEAASGSFVSPRVDDKAILVVRTDRTHISGGYARWINATVTASGDTLIDQAGSGRALRIKTLHDSYLGTSGAVLIGYRLGSGAPLSFRHYVGTVFSGITYPPNWDLDLTGSNIQGGIAGAAGVGLSQGALIANINLALTSGLSVTAVLEEVGSGALF